MKCPECQHDNPDNAKFCRKCGTKLPSCCPNCGNPVEPGDSFCMECGAKLDRAASVPTEAAVPRLEDMQDRLYIPEPLRRRMDTAEQEMRGENRLVEAWS